MGFYLPKKDEITWPYIFAILEGRKKLILHKNIKILIPPPRLKQLYVKNLWNNLKSDRTFNIYFSDKSCRNTPGRTYFFAILSTIYYDEYKQLLAETEEQRLMLEEKKNRTVQLDDEMLSLFQNIEDLNLITGKKKNKRFVKFSRMK